LLRHGLSLDKVKLLRAQVSWLSEQQLRFVLHEDRKRQIRSMCEQVGLRVDQHQARSYRQRIARQAAIRAMALSAPGRALLIQANRVRPLAG
jgi:16S rRNA U516 pseudouridylate synthase RsuA-like enzyme